MSNKGWQEGVRDEQRNGRCEADLMGDGRKGGGFDFYSTQKACCGTGGDYNFSFITKMYGDPGILVCQNLSKHLSSDGVHLIEEAYKRMVGWLIDDILPKLHCSV
ncbi:hypothetical protein C3L33_09117, partial [Rhododendron williamsianum]